MIIDYRKAIKSLKRKKLTLDHLTPDHLTTIAYCVHTLRDKEHQDTDSQELAHKVVDDFSSWSDEIEPFSKDGKYYTKVMAEVVSLANAISKHKREFLAAQEAINLADRKTKNRQKWEVVIAAVWNAIYMFSKVAGFGLLAAGLTTLIKPAVTHQTVSHLTDAMFTAASILIGAFITFAISRYWNDYKRAVESKEIQNRDKLARKEHSIDRLQSTLEHLSKLHMIWYEYTGTEYCVPVELSPHAASIAQEIKTMEDLDKQLQELTMSPLMLLTNKCLKAILKLKPSKRAVALPA